MATVLPELSDNYAAALRLIDEAHALDPNKVKGQDTPYELHYAHKMTAWLAKRCPTASPVVQPACRAQHFRRWEIPRGDYPMTRPGYLTWRAKLKAQAANQVAELIGTSAVVVPPLASDDVERVAALIRKTDLNHDEEVQVLEDTACLVFLDDQLDDFDRRGEHDEDKIVSILQKTWVKMSEEGRRIALSMDHSERALALLGKALQS